MDDDNHNENNKDGYEDIENYLKWIIKNKVYQLTKGRGMHKYKSLSGQDKNAKFMANPFDIQIHSWQILNRLQINYDSLLCTDNGSITKEANRLRTVIQCNKVKQAQRSKKSYIASDNTAFMNDQKNSNIIPQDTLNHVEDNENNSMSDDEDHDLFDTRRHANKSPINPGRHDTLNDPNLVLKSPKILQQQYANINGNLSGGSSSDRGFVSSHDDDEDGVEEEPQKHHNFSANQEQHGPSQEQQQIMIDSDHSDQHPHNYQQEQDAMAASSLLEQMQPESPQSTYDIEEEENKQTEVKEDIVPSAKQEEEEEDGTTIFAICSSQLPDGVVVGEPCRFTSSRCCSGDTYLWDFDDGTCCETYLPMIKHAYQRPDFYDVRMTVVDTNGNTTTDTMRQRIYQNPNFYLSNASEHPENYGSDLSNISDTFYGMDRLQMCQFIHGVKILVKYPAYILPIVDYWELLTDEMGMEAIAVEEIDVEVQTDLFNYMVRALKACIR
eukprot:182616_1